MDKLGRIFCQQRIHYSVSHEHTNVEDLAKEHNDEASKPSLPDQLGFPDIQAYQSEQLKHQSIRTEEMDCSVGIATIENADGISKRMEHNRHSKQQSAQNACETTPMHQFRYHD